MAGPLEPPPDFGSAPVTTPSNPYAPGYGQAGPSIFGVTQDIQNAQAQAGLGQIRYGFGKDSLRRQYEESLARLGLQGRGLAADRGASTRQFGLGQQLMDLQGGDIGFKKGLAEQLFGVTNEGFGAQGQYLGAQHGLAGQLFELNKGDALRAYQADQRQTIGQRAARGSYRSTGAAQDLGDLSSQYRSALGRIGVQQGQEQAGYTRDTTMLGLDQKRAGYEYGGQVHDLDAAAARLGVSREQAQVDYDHANTQFDILADKLGIDRSALDTQLNDGLTALGMDQADQQLAAKIQIAKIAQQYPDIIQKVIAEGLATVQA